MEKRFTIVKLPEIPKLTKTVREIALDNKREDVVTLDLH